MDVRSLEIYLAIAEEGSIHAGARKAMIAQPAASKYLRKLERALGTPLVNRSTKGIELTAAGVVLASEAKQILARLRRIPDMLEDSAVSEPLTVGLASGNLAAGEHTLDILGAFRRAFSGIELRVRELSFTQQYSAVSNGDVDLAIVRPPCDRGDLEMAYLFEEPRVFCVRADSEYASAESVSAEDIVDETYVNLSGSRPEWASFWNLDDVRNEPAKLTRTIATTATEMQHTVLSGQGVVPIARSAWGLGIAHPDLRAIELRDTPPSAVAIAYSHSNRRDEIRAFIECAQSRLQATADLDSVVPPQAPVRPV